MLHPGLALKGLQGSRQQLWALQRSGFLAGAGLASLHSASELPASNMARGQERGSWSPAPRLELGHPGISRGALGNPCELPFPHL